jgi:hypothetical protein
VYSPARLFTLMVSMAAVIGCQRANEPARTEFAPGKAVADAKASDKSMPPSAAQPVLKPKPAATAIADFKTPFPERKDMFEPPPREKSAVRRDDEHGQSVELKGFINVDQPRVVLSIDGVITAVPEGGEKYGVQVISIQPPSVVLQRGRNRWPATLE